MHLFLLLTFFLRVIFIYFMKKKKGRRELNWNLVFKSVCRRWLDLEAFGNFFFVHTPSVERLPQAVLQHGKEEMEKFIRLFIKLFSQSVKIISMLEKKRKECVETEEHVWVSSWTAAQPETWGLLLTVAASALKPSPDTCGIKAWLDGLWTEEME